jgi:acyl-CoA thioesterase FadM
VNLWLRLVVVIFQALFRRRLGVMDESVLSFVVLPNDLDTNIHMNNARYMAHMDLGRLDLMLRNGLFGHIRRERWMPVVAMATVRFSRSLAPFERFTLRTRLIAWDEKWFYVEQRIETRGRPAATAILRAAFRGPKGVVPPAEVLAVAAYHGPTPPLPSWLGAWRALDAAHSVIL